MKQAQRALIVLFTLVFSQLATSAGWKEIRTSPSGKSGWQYVVCQGGSGWNTCELDLNIVLTAAPNQLVAVGEQATIYATVTDAYNNPVEAGVRIGWVTTDGSVSATESRTDANGVATIVLTSSHSLGGATVTANALDYGGAGSLFVPYIDKWVAYPSTYTAWANYGAYYSCSAWDPDPSTVAAGTWFSQTAWCWQQQQQWRQDRLQSVVTGAVINNGPAVPLYQTITVAISQMNVGTKQSIPTCEFNQEDPFPNNHATAWTYDERTSSASNNLVLNGVTVFTMPAVVKQRQPWTGSYVYNGRVYTYGNFQYATIGSKWDTYYFTVCSAPL
ncbi:Ig-like domain-containing protein [Pseudomonas frederiksbergensis]